VHKRHHVVALEVLLRDQLVQALFGLGGEERCGGRGVHAGADEWMDWVRRGSVISERLPAGVQLQTAAPSTHVPRVGLCDQVQHGGLGLALGQVADGLSQSHPPCGTDQRRRPHGVLVSHHRMGSGAAGGCIRR